MKSKKPEALDFTTDRSNAIYHLSIILSLLLLSACSTQLPPRGVSAFSQCNYAEAAKVFESGIKEGNKDEALFSMAMLSSALYASDVERAERAALRSQSLIWDLGGRGRGRASLLSSEAIKNFKGEPFEKAMVSIYSGILYYNKGEFDNARAAFFKANLAIQQKFKKGGKSDFGLANFLRAKVLADLGEMDNSKISLSMAQERYPQNVFLQDKNLAEPNVVFVIELGRGPRKVRTGPGDSLIAWQEPRYQVSGAQVYVPSTNQKIKAQEVGNLTFQALSKESTGKDTVQAVKGTLREAAIITGVIAASEASENKKNKEGAGWVALGAGLFALANQSQADIRQWSLLPNQFLLATAKLPEGIHEIGVDFIDQQNQILPLRRKFRTIKISDTMPKQIVLVSSRVCN